MSSLFRKPNVKIDDHAQKKFAVVVIPEGLVVGEDRIEDAKWFRVTDRGTVLITQKMLDKREAET